MSTEAASATSGAAGAASPHPHRWIAAAVLIAAFLMDLLDVTIVNVALPTIQRDLNADPTELEWISAAYLLAFAVAMITTARLGDLWGRKRVFLIAVGAFGVASLWCSAAGGPGELIAARAAQGLAAAGIAPQVMSTLHGIFEGEERGSVFGVFGIVAGVAQTLGLVVGGLLITANVGTLGWRTIFLVNAPVAVLVILLGSRFIPETRVPGATRPSPLSAGVLTVGLVAIIFPLMEGRQHGWPAWTWLSIAVGVATIAALAISEQRRGGDRTAPLLPAGLFRKRSFTAGLSVLLLAFGGYSGYLLVFALWLQNGEGFTPLAAGLVTIAFCAGSLVTAICAGRLTMRYGRYVVAGGSLMFTVGLVGVLAAGLAERAVSAWALVPGLLLLGAGFNLIIPPLTTLFLADVPPEQAGTASGIWSTTQQFAGAMGVAVIGAVFFSTLDDSGHREGFTATTVSTAVVLVACAVLCLALPPTRKPAAVAERA